MDNLTQNNSTSYKCIMTMRSGDDRNELPYFQLVTHRSLNSLSISTLSFSTQLTINPHVSDTIILPYKTPPSMVIQKTTTIQTTLKKSRVSSYGYKKHLKWCWTSVSKMATIPQFILNSGKVDEPLTKALEDYECGNANCFHN